MVRDLGLRPPLSLCPWPLPGALPAFANVAVAALAAFLLFALKPTVPPDRAPRIRFPWNKEIGLAGGNLKGAHDSRSQNKT
jgi:hypothetical protein